MSLEKFVESAMRPSPLELSSIRPLGQNDADRAFSRADEQLTRLEEHAVAAADLRKREATPRIKSADELSKFGRFVRKFVM